MKLATYLSILSVFFVACASTKGDVSSNATSVNRPPPSQNARAGDLPDFSLETLEGEPFRLSEHLGRKVIVLSFWATWCLPCLEELPHLSELYERKKAEGLMVVAISMDEPTTQAEVAPTARRIGLMMPVVLDAEQEAIRLYNQARNAPMTVVIDKQGRIVRTQSGYSPGDEEILEKEILALLQE